MEDEASKKVKEFFRALPTNRKSTFACATTSSGCEIWIPVDSVSDRTIRARLNELKKMIAILEGRDEQTTGIL